MDDLQGIAAEGLMARVLEIMQQQQATDRRMGEAAARRRRARAGGGRGRGRRGRRGRGRARARARALCGGVD